MSTPFRKKFRDLCMYLGSNNKALYGALTIAASKGVLRPTFTMMDKRQDKSSRTYTAFREGLTGATAFASYLVTNAFVEKTANYIAKKTNHINELGKMQSTLSLITVSLTALFIIPGICNMATKPLLNLFTKKKQNIVPKENSSVVTPLSGALHKSGQAVNFNGFRTPYNSKSGYNFGMRIGGI